MNPMNFADIVQQEHRRMTARVNRDGWKFEHIEQPARARIKFATLRRMAVGR